MKTRCTPPTSSFTQLTQVHIYLLLRLHHHDLSPPAVFSIAPYPAVNPPSRFPLLCLPSFSWSPSHSTGNPFLPRFPVTRRPISPTRLVWQVIIAIRGLRRRSTATILSNITCFTDFWMIRDVDEYLSL